MAYHGPRGRVQSSMPGTYHESERDPYAYSPRSTKPKSPPPKARGYSFPPPPPLFDTSPEPYTYEDEEPERIPIAPMPWNGYSSSASKEELINYFIDRGFDPKVAAAQIDREFTAHAPQHLAGQTHAGLPRAQVPGRHTTGEDRWRNRNKDRIPSPEPSRHTRPQAQRRERRRSPSPSGRSTPSPDSSPRHGYYLSSRYRATSPPRSHGKYDMPPHPPSYSTELPRRPRRSERERESGSRQERAERKESRTWPRAPTPPPAATRDEAGRERKKSTRKY